MLFLLLILLLCVKINSQIIKKKRISLLTYGSSQFYNRNSGIEHWLATMCWMFEFIYYTLGYLSAILLIVDFANSCLLLTTVWRGRSFLFH